MIDKSSPPRATMTLMGGRDLLDSWVSTVALMAFYGKEMEGYQLLGILIDICMSVTSDSVLAFYISV